MAAREWWPGPWGSPFGAHFKRLNCSLQVGGSQVLLVVRRTQDFLLTVGETRRVLSPQERKTLRRKIPLGGGLPLSGFQRPARSQLGT